MEGVFEGSVVGEWEKRMVTPRSISTSCLVILSGFLILSAGCGEIESGASAGAGEQALGSAPAPRQESYITFVEPDRKRRDLLGRRLSIDAVQGDRVWAYAWPPGLKKLAAKGVEFQILPHPGLNPGARMGIFDAKGELRLDAYPTYAEYVQLMQGFAADHPDLCRLVEFGRSSNQNRPHKLLALKITDNPDEDEDEPEVFLTSTMHGDETVGYVLMLQLIDELLSNYGSDPELTAYVDGMEIWINPLANPDGTYYSSDNSVSGAIRAYVEADGSEAWVDPNRNFPCPVEGDHPDGQPWWRETMAMMDFMAARHFVLSGNFHGGAEVLNYPWDHKAALHPDDDWFVALSRAYAEACQADGPAYYMTDLDDGITNGYAWYQTTGSRQDYAVYFTGGREVTIEVSSTKNPGASTLAGYWTANRRALLNYMGAALQGVRGLVTGPTGEPIDATVSVLGRDTEVDASAVRTDPALGNYHRLLAPGSYDLRFAAEGYISQDVAGVVVGTGAATRVDVQLAMAERLELRVLVQDERDNPVAGARVEFLGTSQPEGLSRRNGSLGIQDFPAGAYSLRVSRPGFETLREDRNISQADASHSFVLHRVLALVDADFESDAGGLVASGSPAPGWERGQAVASWGAHSGSRVWATDLSGDYADNATWRLDSAPVKLLPVNPTLRFWQRYAIEVGWDGGNVKISSDGGQSFARLSPEGGYPVAAVDALNAPGYSGNSGGWVEAEFDLSAYAGQTVVLRWDFASDGSETDFGWAIDDVLVTGRKQ